MAWSRVYPALLRSPAAEAQGDLVNPLHSRCATEALWLIGEALLKQATTGVRFGMEPGLPGVVA